MHLPLCDIFFPRFCIGCGKIGQYFCTKCVLQVKPILTSETICPVCERGSFDGFTHIGCKNKYSLDGLVSFFHYKGVMKKALKEIKYRFVADSIKHVLKLISQDTLSRVELLITDSSIIIPIPLHPARERYRGFNQAVLISNYLSEMFHIPVKKDYIRRSKNTISQTIRMSKKERYVNMKHVFVANCNIHSSRIFLVDDVFTTGATLGDACRSLKRAGAKEVFGVTIAR